MPLLETGIVAGAALAGQGVNAYAQGKMNKKTRKWNEAMYEKQKQDNIAQWHMQNDYNSPTSQMQRLREAGLNPNLVYGNGADVTASPIQNASPASWNPKAPEVDLGSVARGGLAAYYDTELKQAQTDNVKAQNTVLAQDAILKGAQTANLNMDWEDKNFTLGQKQAVNEYFIDATKENLRSLQINNKYAEQKYQGDLNEQMARIAKTQTDTKHSEASIQAILKDNQLRDLNIWLQKNGVSMNDPMLMRMIGQGVQSILKGQSIGSWVETVKNKMSGR